MIFYSQKSKLDNAICNSFQKHYILINYKNEVTYNTFITTLLNNPLCKS